ncbi:hypothetical protein GH714_008465 [Hevea brasiliensis]|uniref:Uncharacterized protein n=1 Tax=Hevea brasiliensis TaxID=3981 RepID=A0A6A6LZ70_HEVBR|nr:hypothetical protein GH714_008465 [Hevea brasiliensis]
MSTVLKITTSFKLAAPAASVLNKEDIKVYDMSGLVDIWTAELAKLREKGQAIWSSKSSTTTSEPSKLARSEGANQAESLATLVRGMRVKSSGLAFSEASLSMLIDCFSA